MTFLGLRAFTSRPTITEESIPPLQPHEHRIQRIVQVKQEYNPVTEAHSTTGPQ